MPHYQQPQWSVELPEGWHAEREDEGTLFHRADGVGTLAVTLLCDKDRVTRETLLELAAPTREEGHDSTDIQVGSHSGLYFSYGEESTAWREWYLAAGHCVFFVSYDCLQADEAKESAEVDAIIAALTLTV